MDELPPAEDLPEKALPAGERDRQRQGLGHDAPREEAVKVQKARHARVEERGRPRGHRVLEGAEPRQALAPRPAPQGVGIAGGGGQGGEVEAPRVRGEALLDQLADLVRHGIRREHGWRGGRGLAAPGPAVFGVEAEAPARGPSVLHEQPALFADVPVEAVHPPAPSAREGRVEVHPAGQPALVRQHLDGAARDEVREVRAQLALGGLLATQRADLAGERCEGLRKASLRRDVPNGDPAARLLEGEVAKVREHERQLLAVVGPSLRLPRRLHEDDPELARILARQRADGVAELVVGNEEPAAAGGGRAARSELGGEGAARAHEPSLSGRA